THADFDAAGDDCLDGQWTTSRAIGEYVAAGATDDLGDLLTNLKAGGYSVVGYCVRHAKRRVGTPAGGCECDLEDGVVIAAPPDARSDIGEG
ncbi:hypothetical protein ACC691_38750, partial [Rhizobium johnstonii]|uniref:hypothetical protein n=1 Tax=Rhizobium johnstonii TaxID=3019933 RepID=UPI003F96D877